MSKLEAYRQGVEAHLGASVATRFAAAAMPLEAVAGDLDDLAAQALVRAMLETESPPSLALTSVELEINDNKVALKPHEAHGHPLLAGWIWDESALALGDAIRAGRVLTTLAANAPVFDQFRVSRSPAGEVFAVAQLSFETGQGWVVARCHYGTAPALAYVQSTAITGTGAFNIGVRVREGGGFLAELAAMAAEAAAEASSSAEPGDVLAGETLH